MTFWTPISYNCENTLSIMGVSISFISLSLLFFGFVAPAGELIQGKVLILACWLCLEGFVEALLKHCAFSFHLLSVVKEKNIRA